MPDDDGNDNVDDDAEDTATALTSTPARNATRFDRVSQQRWWRFVLQALCALSPILYAGRLFHEMVVDAFASISSARLKWIRLNQKNLRVARAQGLIDALAHEDWTANDIGRRVILPASFTGSPRQMRDAYLDAMALARYFGNPGYFLTLTCNTSWQEITRELKPGQQPTDRPDIVNRLFNLKLGQLFHELIQKSILGRVAVMVWTIEFQKRGLPHAHILLIMHPPARPQLPDDVDRVVCAEIPDPAREPLLHDVVCHFMLHHPCGEENPDASCMRAGRCRSRFPKQYQDETVFQGGRPVYRRRDDGRVHLKGRNKYAYTNRHVAPYNPYLSARLNAHVNVECCSGIVGIKYVYKYIYKGPDRVMLRVGMEPQGQQEQLEPVDEIAEYIDARYISTHEALWRIMEFKTHGRTVPVQRLQIHLEGDQVVMISDRLSLREQENLASKLTGSGHVTSPPI